MATKPKEQKLKILWPRTHERLWHEWMEARFQFERDVHRPVKELRVVKFQPTDSWGDEHIWLPNGRIVRAHGPIAARLFDDASSQYLQVDAVPSLTLPFAVGCWFRTNDTAADQTIIYIGDKDSSNVNFFFMQTLTVTGTPRLRWTIVGSVGLTGVAESTGTVVVNTWHHGLGNEIASNSREVFLDGANRGANATSRSLGAAVDRIAIGRRGDSTPSNYFSGDLAEAAAWDDELTDDEAAMLGKAVSAFMVRPAQLRTYIPIIGRHTAEPDFMSINSLTVSGATQSAHPRIFLPPVVDYAALLFSTIVNKTISAVAAAATAEGYAAVIAISKAIAGVLATATADGYASVVSISEIISAVVAEATADGYAAVIAISKAIESVLATATADGYAAVISISELIAAVTAEASADSIAPVILAIMNATIAAIGAEAAAAALAAVISISKAVAAEIAEATAQGYSPAVTLHPIIAGAVAAATADGGIPSILLSIMIAAAVAEASAEGLIPSAAAQRTITILQDYLATATGGMWNPKLNPLPTVEELYTLGIRIPQTRPSRHRSPTNKRLRERR